LIANIERKNMNKFEVLENLRNLDDREKQNELAFKLFESEEIDILSLLLEVIQNSEAYDTTIDTEMFIEIIEKPETKRDAIIDRIIHEIEKSALSPQGMAYTYALGEIVRLQLTTFRQVPNSKIKQVLLKMGEANTLKATTEELSQIVFALLQYANGKSLPEAELFLRKVFEVCEGESDKNLDTFTLGYTLELLYLNNGETFLIEMKELFKNLKKDTELANCIEMFIVEKEEEEEERLIEA
jgi:hypothetical protein